EAYKQLGNLSCVSPWVYLFVSVSGLVLGIRRIFVMKDIKGKFVGLVFSIMGMWMFCAFMACMSYDKLCQAQDIGLSGEMFANYEQVFVHWRASFYFANGLTSILAWAVFLVYFISSRNKQKLARQTSVRRYEPSRDIRHRMATPGCLLPITLVTISVLFFLFLPHAHAGQFSEALISVSGFPIIAAAIVILRIIFKSIINFLLVLSRWLMSVREDWSLQKYLEQIPCVISCLNNSGYDFAVRLYQDRKLVNMAVRLKSIQEALSFDRYTKERDKGHYDWPNVKTDRDIVMRHLIEVKKSTIIQNLSWLNEVANLPDQLIGPDGKLKIQLPLKLIIRDRELKALKDFFVAGKNKDLLACFSGAEHVFDFSSANFLPAAIEQNADTGDIMLLRNKLSRMQMMFTAYQEMLSFRGYQVWGEVESAIAQINSDACSQAVIAQARQLAELMPAPQHITVDENDENNWFKWFSLEECNINYRFYRPVVGNGCLEPCNHCWRGNVEHLALFDPLPVAIYKIIRFNAANSRPWKFYGYGANHILEWRDPFFGAHLDSLVEFSLQLNPRQEFCLSIKGWDEFDMCAQGVIERIGRLRIRRRKIFPLSFHLFLSGEFDIIKAIYEDPDHEVPDELIERYAQRYAKNIKALGMNLEEITLHNVFQTRSLDAAMLRLTERTFQLLGVSKRTIRSTKDWVGCLLPMQIRGQAKRRKVGPYTLAIESFYPEGNGACFLERLEAAQRGDVSCLEMDSKRHTEFVRHYPMVEVDDQKRVVVCSIVDGRKREVLVSSTLDELDPIKNDIYGFDPADKSNFALAAIVQDTRYYSAYQWAMRAGGVFRPVAWIIALIVVPFCESMRFSRMDNPADSFMQAHENYSTKQKAKIFRLGINWFTHPYFWNWYTWPLGLLRAIVWHSWYNLMVLIGWSAPEAPIAVIQSMANVVPAKLKLTAALKLILLFVFWIGTSALIFRASKQSIALYYYNITFSTLYISILIMAIVLLLGWKCVKLAKSGYCCAEYLAGAIGMIITAPLLVIPIYAFSTNGILSGLGYEPFLAFLFVALMVGVLEGLFILAETGVGEYIHDFGHVYYGKLSAVFSGLKTKKLISCLGGPFLNLVAGNIGLCILWWASLWKIHLMSSNLAILCGIILGVVSTITWVNLTFGIGALLPLRKEHGGCLVLLLLWGLISNILNKASKKHFCPDFDAKRNDQLPKNAQPSGDPSNPGTPYNSTPQTAAVTSLAVIILGGLFSLSLYNSWAGVACAMAALILSGLFYSHALRTSAALDLLETTPIRAGPLHLKVFTDRRPIASTFSGFTIGLKENLNSIDIFLTRLHEAVHRCLYLTEASPFVASFHTVLVEAVISIIELLLLLSVLGAFLIIWWDRDVELAPGISIPTKHKGMECASIKGQFDIEQDIPEGLLKAFLLFMRERGIDVAVCGGAVKDAFVGRRTYDLDLVVKLAAGRFIGEDYLHSICSLALKAKRNIAKQLGVPYHNICKKRLNFCGYRIDFLTGSQIADGRVFVENTGARICYMAIDTRGNFYDPYDGCSDLSSGLLRFAKENPSINEILKLVYSVHKYGMGYHSSVLSTIKAAVAFHCAKTLYGRISSAANQASVLMQNTSWRHYLDIKCLVYFMLNKIRILKRIAYFIHGEETGALVDLLIRVPDMDAAWRDLTRFGLDKYFEARGIDTKKLIVSVRAQRSQSSRCSDIARQSGNFAAFLPVGICTTIAPIVLAILIAMIVFKLVSMKCNANEMYPGTREARAKVYGWSGAILIIQVIIAFAFSNIIIITTTSLFCVAIGFISVCKCLWLLDPLNSKKMFSLLIAVLGLAAAKTSPVFAEQMVNSGNCSWWQFYSMPALAAILIIVFYVMREGFFRSERPAKKLSADLVIDEATYGVLAREISNYALPEAGSLSKVCVIAYPDRERLMFANHDLVTVYDYQGSNVAYISPDNWGCAVIVPMGCDIDIFTNDNRNCPILIMHLLGPGGLHYKLLAHVWAFEGYDSINSQLTYICGQLAEKQMTPLEILLLPRTDTMDKMKVSTDCFKTLGDVQAVTQVRGDGMIAGVLVADNGWAMGERHRGTGSLEYTFKQWQESNIPAITIPADRLIRPITNTGENIGQGLPFTLQAEFAEDQQSAFFISHAGNSAMWYAQAEDDPNDFSAGACGFISVAISSDAKELAAIEHGGKAALFDRKTMCLKHRYSIAGVYTAIAFLPGDTRLALGTDSGGIFIIDKDSGAKLADGFVHNQPITALAADPQAGYLYVGNEIGYTCCFAIGEHTLDLAGYLFRQPYEITAYDFSKDGSRMLIASYSKTVRIWDPVKKELLGFIYNAGARPVCSAVFSPDGQSVLLVDTIGAIRRFWLSDMVPAQRDNVVPGPLLPKANVGVGFDGNCPRRSDSGTSLILWPSLVLAAIAVILLLVWLGVAWYHAPPNVALDKTVDLLNKSGVVFIVAVLCGACIFGRLIRKRVDVTSLRWLVFLSIIDAAFFAWTPIFPRSIISSVGAGAYIITLYPIALILIWFIYPLVAGIRAGQPFVDEAKVIRGFWSRKTTIVGIAVPSAVLLIIGSLCSQPIAAPLMYWCYSFSSQASLNVGPVEWAIIFQLSVVLPVALNWLRGKGKPQLNQVLGLGLVVLSVVLNASLLQALKESSQGLGIIAVLVSVMHKLFTFNSAIKIAILSSVAYAFQRFFHNWAFDCGPTDECPQCKRAAATIGYFIGWLIVPLFMQCGILLNTQHMPVYWPIIPFDPSVFSSLIISAAANAVAFSAGWMIMLYVMSLYGSDSYKTKKGAFGFAHFMTILASYPLFTALYQALLTKTWPSPVQLAFCVMAMAGVWLALRKAKAGNSSNPDSRNALEEEIFLVFRYKTYRLVFGWLWLTLQIIKQVCLPKFSGVNCKPEFLSAIKPLKARIAAALANRVYPILVAAANCKDERFAVCTKAKKSIEQRMHLTNLHANLLINQKTGEGLLIFGSPGCGKGLLSLFLLMEDDSPWIFGANDLIYAFFENNILLAGSGHADGKYEYWSFDVRNAQGEAVEIIHPSVKPYYGFVKVKDVIVLGLDDPLENGSAVQLALSRDAIISRLIKEDSEILYPIPAEFAAQLAQFERLWSISLPTEPAKRDYLAVFAALLENIGKPKPDTLGSSHSNPNSDLHDVLVVGGGIAGTG
ncbi:MAG: hypothetical protein NTY47_03805, partial [Candidatus Omnitrophica bacterium]|nr:hypothetical protein [Candidatus Omnitrophota bacterium]